MEPFWQSERVLSVVMESNQNLMCVNWRLMVKLGTHGEQPESFTQWESHTLLSSAALEVTGVKQGCNNLCKNWTDLLKIQNKYCVQDHSIKIQRAGVVLCAIYSFTTITTNEKTNKKSPKTKKSQTNKNQKIPKIKKPI